MPLAAALQSALADGATMITPNNRLARRLAGLHDDRQRTAGARTWPTPAILPWAAWLGERWQQLIGSDSPAPARVLLQPTQSAHLWRSIVAAHFVDGGALVDPEAAAALAAEAWTRLHGWGAGGDSWRGWDRTTAGDDPAAFARAAHAYAQRLRQIGAVDHALAADQLAAAPAVLRGPANAPLVFAGFAEFTPQQQRLIAAMRAEGIAVRAFDPIGSAVPTARVAACGTPGEEVAAALAWARERLRAAPAAHIGIAVVDLAARREEIIALADDALCPQLAWPDVVAAPRPYSISLGLPLADVPLVAAALDLVALAHGSLPVPQAAALLRSRHLPGDEWAWARRAALELTWRARGAPVVGLPELIRDLRRHDAALGQRWHDARQQWRPPERATPAAWAASWRAWLGALGWPGERMLDSAGFQAHQAWEDLLARFAGLALVDAALSRRDAVGALGALAGDAVFQPEAAAAPIEILGLLEAAGQPYDALWVAGLTADAWPPAPRPNPFLPIAWQRERNVPHSSAARELRYARELTSAFARAAPEVVLSHATRVDQHRCGPSALLAAYPGVAATTAARRSSAAQAFEQRPSLATIDDTMASPLPPGIAYRGGAALLEQQSDCPFRAFATRRLGAAPWLPVPAGLTAAERGNLVHATFAALARAAGDFTTLRALSDDALAAAIDAAIGAAWASGAVDPERWQQLPPLVEPAERQRIAALVGRWLAGFEFPRSGSATIAVEAPVEFALRGLALHLRIDRVDRLPDGSHAIIDYKTGVTVAPGRWFDDRPQATQLALYLLACRAAGMLQPVSALVYAQQKSGRAGWAGLVADPTAWPGLGDVATASAGRIADWPAAIAFWDAKLAALADEFVAGHAGVLPRSLTVCRSCGLEPLCRIAAAPAIAGEVGDDGD